MSRERGQSTISSLNTATNTLVYDRWSNHINYNQLIVSSCISIVQLWWHPYVHDLTKLVPFIFLYNVVSVLISYPMFYLELAFGVVTKKSVLRCWDLAPIARGTSLTMLLLCVYMIMATSTVSSYCFIMFYLSTNAFLPWLDCASTARYACSARHRTCAPGSDTPPQSFLFNWIMDLKRGNIVESGLGKVVLPLMSFYLIAWILTFLIVCKKIYSFSKVVLIKDVMTYFTLVSCFTGVMCLKGSNKMFLISDWNSLYDYKLWKDAVEYSLLQMSVSQGTLIMLGTYCPKKRHHLSWTAFITFLVSKICTTMAAFILGGVHGALSIDYDNSSINLMGGASASLVLWADYTARTPGSQFWSILIFATLFIVSISTTALLVQTMASSFTARCSGLNNFMTLLGICAFFGIFGVLTMCTEGGLHVLNYLMSWPVSKLRLPIATMLGISITYVYGQTTFCEDVFFAVGEYPNTFLRISWALSPWILLALFLVDMSCLTFQTLEGLFGWISVGASTLPIFLMGLFYIFFKCRVRNLLSDK